MVPQDFYRKCIEEEFEVFQTPLGRDGRPAGCSTLQQSAGDQLLHYRHRQAVSRTVNQPRCQNSNEGRPGRMQR
ncbi:hypothetical protein [Psychromicrobium sp. YIM B11713]|uniref:hypothetical protein n=1 Tax=Psychromicrobium sp. YIM B11713 TaxID=3145233 RepID=UPI00374F33D2